MSDFSKYLNVRNAHSGSLRADGSRLAFLFDASGTTQIWMVDAPGAWPTQRTFFPNRVTFVSYAPRGNAVAFGMDEGGDEQVQLYLMDDDGLEITALTDDGSVKHNFGAWSPDGSRIAFSATRENPTDFYVYVLDVATREVRRVCDLPGYNYARAWTPDGSGLIVGHYESNVALDLYHVSLETGETRLLTPHEGDARFMNAELDPSGAHLWVTTDLGRDFLKLARLDLSTLELQFVTEGDWDEEIIVQSADGRFLAVFSNEDGYAALDVLDADTLERRRVCDLPRGVFCYWGGASLGRDGKTVLFDANSSMDATNVWALDLETAHATRWTGVDMGTVPRGALVPPELVRFESFDGLEVPTLVLTPPNATGPRPTVIVIHGGPEAQSRPIFNPVAQYLVSRGFTVVSPNVRGSSGYGKRYQALDDVEKRMDSVKDIEALVRWLVREGRADPERVGVYGGSYGGFMVLACLTTYPELFAAGVDIVGISSLVTFLENTSAYRRKLREAEYGSLSSDRAFLESVSPISRVDRIRAPLFVIHGANDPRVPVTEAESIVRALRERGVPVEYLRFEDEGHGLAKLENKLKAYPEVAAFLEEHLALAKHSSHENLARE